MVQTALLLALTLPRRTLTQWSVCLPHSWLFSSVYLPRSWLFSTLSRQIGAEESFSEVIPMHTKLLPVPCNL